MNNHPSQSVIPARRSAVGGIVGEAALVAAFGAVFALAANQLSPRGLALSRDYFPTGTAHQVRPVADVARPPAAGTNSGTLSPAQSLAAQMKEKGLQLVDARQVWQYFRDPRFGLGAIVFIDARDQEHYRTGHIPGAFEFDPYHPDNYFGAVLPACQQAEQVVVYCNGGDCDDSESAALLLRDVGVSNQKLLIYGGGFTEWTNNRLPVETGARNSGVLLKTNASPGAVPLTTTNK